MTTTSAAPGEFTDAQIPTPRFPVPDSLVGEPSWSIPTGIDPQLFEQAVFHRAYQKLVEQRAEEVLAEWMEAGEPGLDVVLLKDVELDPAGPQFRIEGLVPRHGRVVLVGQRKAGKTTLALDLAQSLLTGGPALGRYPVTPVSDGARLAVLNYEVHASQMARWAIDLQVPGDGLLLVNLRGRRNPLASKAGRRQLVEVLRENRVEVLIVDPIANALTVSSQDDNSGVGRDLRELDRLATSAGVQEIIVTAHAGKRDARARGASALEDWPCSIIYLSTKGKIRQFSAIGRDVDLPARNLRFDAATRRSVEVTGPGTTNDTASSGTDDTTLHDAILGIIAEQPGINESRLIDALKQRHLGVRKHDVSTTLQALHNNGRITRTRGRRNAWEHRIPDTQDTGTEGARDAS